MTSEKQTFNSGLGNDGSDTLANKLGQYIEIYHIPSNQFVRFKAYLTTFTDQYSSNFESALAFGRMDPIQTFQGTQRILSLGWDVPAASFLESKTNLTKASKLISMLYPSYEAGDGGASTISAPPLFKIKFLNLIQDASKEGSPMSDAKTAGLLGTISGFTYEPDIESGFFQPTQAGGDAEAGDAFKLFPQTIKFNCEFTVLHQHKLGWKDSESGERKGFNKFPYNNPHKQDASRDSDAPVPGDGGGTTSAQNRNNEASARKLNGVK